MSRGSSRKVLKKQFFCPNKVKMSFCCPLGSLEHHFKEKRKEKQQRCTHQDFSQIPATGHQPPLRSQRLGVRAVTGLQQPALCRDTRREAGNNKFKFHDQAKQHFIKKRRLFYFIFIILDRILYIYIYIYISDNVDIHRYVSVCVCDFW